MRIRHSLLKQHAFVGTRRAVPALVGRKTLVEILAKLLARTMRSQLAEFFGFSLVYQKRERFAEKEVEYRLRKCARGSSRWFSGGLASSSAHCVQYERNVQCRISFDVLGAADLANRLLLPSVGLHLGAL
jgi:hypothetical protein